MPKETCLHRLLVILPTLNGGGAEKATLTLIGGLNPEEFQVTLFVVKTQGAYWSEIPTGVKVETAIAAGKRILPCLPRILSRLATLAREADLVVGGQELTATYLALTAAKVARRPVVGIIHTDLEQFLPTSSRFDPILLRLLYPMLDRNIAVSRGTASALCRLVPQMEGRTIVLGNPLDLGLIKQRSVEGAPADAPRRYILGMGRLSQEKGFDLLLRAYGILVREGIEQDLVILGEGPERQLLLSLAKTLGIADRVHLPGFAANPYGWLKTAELFVLPSRFEGFGLVLVEVMAVGTPVVAVDALGGGPREILADGDCGTLVPRGDVDALAREMRRLLDNSDLAEDFVRRGQIQSQNYDVSVVIPAYEKLFKQVIPW